MRLQEIILEQQNRDTAYDRMMTEANMKFWSTITKNSMLPLSESAQNDSMNEITAMLYETAWNLPDNKKDIFFEQLLNNPMLDEGVKDFLKKTGEVAVDGMAKAQGAIDNVKKKAVDVALKGAKAVGAFASEVYKNYVPLEAQQQIAKMGKEAIKKVQQGIQKLGDTATKVIEAINKLITTYKKEDPCNTATNESLEMFSQKINEAVENQYFVGEKSGVLDTIVPELQKLEGGLPLKLAKTISMLKSSGTSVYGVDARPIAHDITANNVGAHFNELDKIKNVGLNPDKNPYFPMSKYFKDNNIKSLIKQFDMGISTTGEGTCEIPEKDQRNLVEKFMGPDSEVGKALAAIGLQQLAVGMIEEIKKHPGSFLISVLSAIVTIVSGGTALRLAAVIFGSVLPAIGNAYVEYLKTHNAPAEKIEFAEKVVKAVRFIATIAQVINIASFIEKGWMSLSATELDAPGMDNVPEVFNPAHEMSDLSSASQDILTDWTKADGSFELSPRTVQAFFDNSTENMTPEQFKQFDALVQAAKVDGAKYEELVKVLENPTGNGIIDIDMKNAGRIADTTKTVAPTGGLSAETNITPEEIRDATGISDKELKSLISKEQAEYVRNNLGGSAQIPRGYPMSDEEYAKLAAMGYTQDPFSDEANEYLKQFQDRKDAITKAAYATAAQKAGIELPTDYTLDNEVGLPTDLDGADDIRAKFGDLPDYDKFMVDGLEKDDIRKLYYAVGESEEQLAKITGMISKGELDPTKVKELVDGAATSGQTQSEFMKSLTDTTGSETASNIFDPTAYADIGVDARTAEYFNNSVGSENAQYLINLVRNGQLDPDEIKQVLDTGALAGQNKEEMMKAIEKMATSETPDLSLDEPTPDTTETSATELTPDATASEVIGNDLTNNPTMKGFDSEMQAKVGNKIMKDYTTDPEFAKAWNAEGFDKEGYIEQVAKDNGWFEPLDKDELVKDLKAGGIQDPEMAERVGKQIQDGYENNPAFREKWDAMDDAQQKEFIEKARLEVETLQANEKIASDLMKSDDRLSGLDSRAQKYADGILRNNPDIASTWETMDDASKDLVIKKAEMSSDFQRVLLKDTQDAFRHGVDMNGNTILKFGSTLADGGYDEATLEHIRKLSNLAYGEQSVEFRKAVSNAMKHNGALQGLFDAVRDGNKELITKMAQA